MKRVMLLLLIIVDVLSFSAGKGNYDEAKYRSDVLARASSMIGWKYSNDKRMQAGHADCSSLVGRASHQAGMSGGVTGNSNSSWVTNTDGMAHMVKKVDYSQIKPGDILQFGKVPGKYKGYGHVGYVFENLGNGKFKMLHAGNPVKVSTIDVRTFRSGSYRGVITATDVLIANGYTPVNQNGQVIAPVGVPTGSTGGAWTGNPANLDETYEVSWDEILENYENMIFEGLDKTLNGLLILLTLLTVIQLLKGAVPYLIGTSVNIYKDFVAVLIKYCFYTFLLKNYATVITMMYKIFTGIGSMFVNNNHISTLDELFAVSTKESLTVLKLIDQYHFDFIKILIPGSNLFDITFWKVVILILVVIMIWYFAVRIIFEMMTVFIQFFLGTGLSYIMFSLATNDVTREMGKRPLRTIIGAGLRVTVIVLFASLVFGILEKSGFGEVTLDTVRFETMFIFIASGLLMAFLMNRISKIADNLNS